MGYYDKYLYCEYMTNRHEKTKTDVRHLQSKKLYSKQNAACLLLGCLGPHLKAKKGDFVEQN